MDSTPTDDASNGDACWFGPPERPLVGWLHRPNHGAARGAIVLCPPFAVELNFSHRILRVLAGRLASAGFLVARFDYDGTGQSAGAIDDPGRVTAWTRSVAQAVARVREEDVEWVAAIGLRLGATILAAALADGTEVDAALLWDPCLSGKSFLREQVALLGTLELRQSDQPGTEIVGYRLSPDTTAELRTLQLPRDLPPTPDGTLVLLDGERPSGDRLRRHLGAAGCEWDEYRMPESVFDLSEIAYPEPTAVLDRIVAWLDGRCRMPRRPLRTAPARDPRAVVARTPEGRDIVERLMRFGDGDLFGIATEAVGSDDGTPNARPTSIFVSMGAEPSIGPGRQWVSLARRWAAEGRSSIRFDFSGIGESPPRPGEPARRIYSPSVLQDVCDAMAVAEPSHPRSVLIGVCSGAYAAITTAPHVRAAGVIAINPVLTCGMLSNRQLDPGSPPPRPGSSAPRRGLGRIRSVPASAVRRSLLGVREWGRDARWRDWLADRLTPEVWSIVYALRLAHSPAAPVMPMLDAGIPLLLLLGEHESREPLTRTPGPFARLATAPASRFTVMPDLDHSLRVHASREATAAAMSQFLDTLDDPAAWSRTEAPAVEADDHDLSVRLMSSIAPSHGPFLGPASRRVDRKGPRSGDLLEVAAEEAAPHAVELHYVARRR
jgi:dienelactone hydrolase